MNFAHAIGMGVIEKISADPLPREPFERACNDVNAWRGRCMQAFAQAEAAVTETLLVLSAVQDRGGDVKLRHLVGQRFEDLAAAIGPRGPFEADGKAAHDSLLRFRERESLRKMLAHASGRVTLDRNGRWTAVFELVAIRSRRADRERLAVNQGEGEAMAKSLASAARSLTDNLKNLRLNVEGDATEHPKF